MLPKYLELDSMQQRVYDKLHPMSPVERRKESIQFQALYMVALGKKERAAKLESLTDMEEYKAYRNQLDNENLTFGNV